MNLQWSAIKSIESKTGYTAEYEVEPICRQIQIVTSSYYERKVREQDPDPLPDRIKLDMRLKLDIQWVWKNNFQILLQFYSIDYHVLACF
ncbi:MAG: hypothetical protein K2P83_12860 [Nitrosomonas sp.]|nr:hypothetical protein [Nitrosomonas sp.]